MTLFALFAKESFEVLPDMRCFFENCFILFTLIFALILIFTLIFTIHINIFTLCCSIHVFPSFTHSSSDEVIGWEASKVISFGVHMGLDSIQLSMR